VKVLVCLFVFFCVRIRVCTPVCVCVCLSVCVYVCVSMCVLDDVVHVVVVK
jgi:hypothetical protein